MDDTIYIQHKVRELTQKQLTERLSKLQLTQFHPISSTSDMSLILLFKIVISFIPVITLSFKSIFSYVEYLPISLNVTPE